MIGARCHPERPEYVLLREIRERLAGRRLHQEANQASADVGVREAGAGLRLAVVCRGGEKAAVWGEVLAAEASEGPLAVAGGVGVAVDR